MMTTLRIDNFRSFRRLTVEGLTRVSLLVGTNNAGKTSVLEAAELVLGGTGPPILVRSMRSRGEFVYPRGQRSAYIEVNHLFHGHSLEPGKSFELSALVGESPRSIRCRIIPRPSGNLEGDDETPPLELLRPGSNLALSISGDGMSPDGYLFPMVGYSVRLRLLLNAATTPADKAWKVRFMGTAAPPVSDLQLLWDDFVLTPEETKVTNALQIIEPDIERLAALSGSGSERGGGMFVKLRGSDERIPLGSMGEGIKRLLALSLNLVSSAGGYLLVDEIDTGLHHSVMTQMWRLVVEVARRLDVQVLATTHSLDCVRALAALYEESPHVRDLISLHRIERGAEASIPYSADEILAASQHQMELR
ncbi:AAA family ATPase [Archangium sp.]|uniref:AAA family ATPase n=1 Tax=Archangium sp. TaxID=1872627 RepID=UPI002D74A5F9|nr:AAA family ATPase [Archangium sp.]HYO53598.1 AAA family ATPase [Archangium sp.]